MLFMMCCRACHLLIGIEGTIGTVPYTPCPDCAKPLTRFHGHPAAQSMTNFGYRESHYATKVDADIAKFQFTNL